MAIDTESERQRKVRVHLCDLLALESGLTSWEVDFLDDMADREEAFTPDQMKKIYEIYEQRC